MPMAIAVTSPDLVLPVADPRTPGAHVLRPPAEQDFPSALAETSGLLERHGHLLVVYPGGTPLPYIQRLHTVRAMLETDRIALLPGPLPPLGTAVLVRQLRQLSVCDFTPGVLASAARLLAHYIYAGAQLASGRTVERLPVDLPARGTARAAGSCVVLAGPKPQIVRTGEGALAGPQFATALTYAVGGLGSDWVVGELARHWRVSGVHPVRLPERSPHWWGTHKLVEFAAGIPDVGPLYQMVSSVRQETCHWCGLALIGDRCAFCTAPVVAPADRRTPALPALVPRRALT
ncbi:hypothetical protein [Streptomyces sp. YIM 98790]|uniref:hypothetical protein n=1 Tax=Streptomyces sp. YIM 98790 TaxID=2689077 RepID=UPI00140966A0|nr:hypothetical protein [Streptomyces sp. YIM 98790]